MISFKHKFIFIHAPKTAGNAIQNVLQKYSDDEIINTSIKNIFLNNPVKEFRISKGCNPLL